MKKICGFVFSFVLAGFVVAAPALAQAPAQLYISGVQTSGGAGHTTDDYIELFNPGAVAVNLKDFKLVKRTAHSAADSIIKSWTEDALVPAYSFYLWANTSYSSILALPDTSSSSSVADDNGVALRFGSLDTGQLVDSVAWGLADNGFAVVSGNVPAGSVLQRQDLSGSESIYVPVVGATPRNTSTQVLPPGAEPPDDEPPIAVEPGPVVYLPLEINEILPNPAGSDEGQEAVELYNPNSGAVDLAGWFLGDGLATLPASNALDLSGTIAAGSYKSVVIPGGKFTLNNTGGDSVQLFSPDKKVVDSVTYTGTAGENKSFQKFASGWQWLEASLGQANILPPEEEGPDETEDEDEETEPAKIYGGISINEFYPAFGGDIATPMLEVVNHSDADTDLAGWQVDVASTHLKKPSDTALIIDNENVVTAGGLGTVALGNIASNDFEPAGKYWVILYSPDGKSQDAVNVKNIVSRLSYAKLGISGWQWTNWSPLGENKAFAAPSLQVTEILPAYKEAETDAFVEFQNIGAAPVYLGNLKIKIGTKSVWLGESTLAPQEFAAVFAEDLPAVLTTAGKKVLLVDANDKQVATASYPKGKTGLAYMIQPDGKWIWTAEATPAAANIFAAPEIAAKAPAKTAAKPVTLPTAKVAGAATANPLPPEPSPTQPKKSKKPIWIFGVVGAVLLAAAAVIWFVAKEPEVS
jgi:hypothetical protein